jgi:hypothetical protein
MAIADTGGARFDMGRVISRTFGVIGRNLITMFVLSLIVAIPMLVLNVWNYDDALGMVAGAQFDPNFILVSVTSWLIYVIAAFMLQAGVVHIAVRDLNSQPASIGDAISTGLRHVIPLILIAIVSTIGIAIGLVLLIVPGIILGMMWAVSVPARVVERTGIFESLGRSSDLTKGHRWAIFGLVVAYVLLSVALSLALLPIQAQVMMAVVQGTGPSTTFYLFFGVSTVITMIQSVIASAGIAAIYYELRVVKEGIGPEALAAVFD